MHSSIPAKRAVLVLIVGLLGGAMLAGERGKSKPSSWTQWGGPGQNFVTSSSGLADSWPETGPRKIWSRELGDGYSAILAEADRIYTMYRTEGQEVVIALDARNGETVWERKYDASPAEGHVAQFGEGPRSTPLIVGNKLYAIGVSGRMHCLNKNSGVVVWSQDLWSDTFHGNVLNHGYSSSPIAYKNMIITLVGGENSSVVAFNKNNGKVIWKNQSFENSYSTPKIINVDGQDQLVSFMATEIVGLDPMDGDLRWSYAHENQWKQNVAMPILADGNILFFSSPQAGAKGLRLVRKDDKTEIEEAWSTRKIQFYHVTTVQDRNYVYGSTGTTGPAFMAALNMKTGEIAWRERGFAKANLVKAGKYLIILDEDGTLALATATPQGLTVHSKVPLTEKVSWTVPTVVGKTMFIRDKKTIMALDLG